MQLSVSRSGRRPVPARHEIETSGWTIGQEVGNI